MRISEVIKILSGWDQDGELYASVCTRRGFPNDDDEYGQGEVVSLWNHRREDCEHLRHTGH